MSDDRIDGGVTRSSALRTVLMALDEAAVDPGAPVELLIRVRGKEDRTLSITLENSREMREILKRSIGLD